LILGVGICANRRRGVLGVGLYLFAANMALIALHGSRQDILYWNRYMITGWLGLTLIAGFGFARVLAAVRQPLLRAGVVLLVPALAIGMGYDRADRSSDTWARDFAAYILDSVEPGALLFVEEDNIVFPLSYLHYVEGRRADVEIVMQGINRLDQMRIEPVGTPTYFSHPRELGMPALELVADGLVFRLVPVGSGFTGRPWEGLASFDVIEDAWALRYLDRSLIGNYYFLKAINFEPRDREAALAAVRTLRRVSFDNAVNQVNAGLLLERNLEFREAFEAFDSAAQIDPSNDLAVQRARLWRETLAAVGGMRNPAERAERIATALLDAGQSDLALRVLRGVDTPD
jgi:tetratricopeptide (TPR) repeat protein